MIFLSELKIFWIIFALMFAKHHCKSLAEIYPRTLELEKANCETIASDTGEVIKFD